LSASPWAFKLDLPKKTAKEKLFELGQKLLKVLGAPEQIDFKVYKYNIINKLAEEVNKLTEERAEEILQTLKKEIREA
jgi:hypothetical protein